MPQKKPSPKTVAPSPSWTLDDGISYSLLSRFLNCRERYRLYAVEGRRESSRSKASMDFGTYFHKLLELRAKHPNKSPDQLFRLNKVELPAEDKDVAKVVYEVYHEYYSGDTYKYFATEDVFDVNYQVPGGSKFRLRGRLDETIIDPDRRLRIQENKTKEYIDASNLEATIPFNLQTMFYAVAANIHYNKPISGVLYNVIRKPKHKQTKTDGTRQGFLDRLRGEIMETPSHFFYRWNYDIFPQQMNDWNNYTFHPILLQLRIWWDSVKHDPFSPWTTPDKNGKFSINPHHFLRPFGVYDSLTTGIGDFFDLITRNNPVGTTSGNIPFQELIDEKT